jgi:ABC-2 type transport system ATP-binding protein
MTRRHSGTAIISLRPSGRINFTMPLIETVGLNKNYGSVKALADLSLQVEPGIIGLVGANGAGKSTMLKILLGLIPATSGRASVMGMDVARDIAGIRRIVGYMPEHDCLPADVSATEFVTHMARISGLPRTAARERTAEVLRHVGLYEERYRQIGGYSTGMKQRVKLAQALVHDPKLLLLDEPTNGLDPTGRDEMLDLILRTGSEFGISVVVASHLLGEIEQVCNYLLAIDAGHLLQSAPVAHFTQRTQVLTVEVEEGSERLGDALANRGIKVARDGDCVMLELEGEDEALYDAVRDLVADLDLPLVRVVEQRGRLEDLFREAAPVGEVAS